MPIDTHNQSRPLKRCTRHRGQRDDGRPGILARVASHIPNDGQVLQRYCGWYASRTRGIRRRAGSEGLWFELFEAAGNDRRFSFFSPRYVWPPPGQHRGRFWFHRLPRSWNRDSNTGASSRNEQALDRLCPRMQRQIKSAPMHRDEETAA